MGLGRDWGHTVEARLVVLVLGTLGVGGRRERARGRKEWVEGILEGCSILLGRRIGVKAGCIGFKVTLHHSRRFESGFVHMELGLTSLILRSVGVHRRGAGRLHVFGSGQFILRNRPRHMWRPVNALILLNPLPSMSLPLPFPAGKSLCSDIRQVCQVPCLPLTAHRRRGRMEQVHITTELGS